MHHLFMLVVILALLPTALATAVALGRVLFVLLGAALVLVLVVFLLANPSFLLAIVGVALVFYGAIGIGLGTVWVAAKIETRWPMLLQRLGFGGVALICAFTAILLPISGVRSGANLSEGILLFFTFGIISAVFSWAAIKARPSGKGRLVEKLTSKSPTHLGH